MCAFLFVPEGRETNKVNIIIAFYNVKFAKDFKAQMAAYNVNVLDIVTSDEDLVAVLKEHRNNVNGVLIQSDLATKLGEQRLETLTDILASLREEPTFQKVVFTVLSNEKSGHPFLAELVDMGIYNIFVRNEGSFTVKNIVESFEVPRSFSSTVGYRKVDPGIPWRRNLIKQNSLKIEFNNSETQAAVTKTEADPPSKTKKDFLNVPKLFKRGSKENNPNEEETSHATEERTDTTSKFQSESPEPALPTENKTKEAAEPDDWSYDDNVFSDGIKNQEQVIGTVLIGVAGVTKNIGCTHTAISIAKHLAAKGHDVALVEGNHSQDFDRIHVLYEGAKKTLQIPHFELQGIIHIKYRDEVDLNRVFTNYDYVVMDLGLLEESPYREEFQRSHVKCVVASADEWKFYYCEDFLQVYKELDDLTFLVPSVTKKVADDLQERLKGFPAFPVPHHDSPYVLDEPTNKVWTNLLNMYYRQRKGFDTKILILVSLVSVVVTALAFTTAIIFKILL